MASPARHRDRAGKLQLLAVQCWGSEQEPENSSFWRSSVGAQSISQGTFYKFKSKYGGMEVSDAAKLRAVTDENAKLKRLLAEAMLDNVVLKDLLGKN